MIMGTIFVFANMSNGLIAENGDKFSVFVIAPTKYCDYILISPDYFIVVFYRLVRMLCKLLNRFQNAFSSVVHSCAESG